MPSGFNVWIKLNPRLLEHKGSSYQLTAFKMWKENEMRLQKQETFDVVAQLAQHKSFEKWNAILARILDFVLYPNIQTLNLCGHSGYLITDDNS